VDTQRQIGRQTDAAAIIAVAVSFAIGFMRQGFNEPFDAWGCRKAEGFLAIIPGIIVAWLSSAITRNLRATHGKWGLSSVM
jgi:integral membrane sensor domain MASE1